VISHDYWQRRFHADPGVLGQRVQISEKTYSIIGVARQGFFGVEPGKFVDIWQPAMMYSKPAFTSIGWNWFRIIGRTEPGPTRAQLQARLQPTLRVYAEELVKLFPTMPPTIQKQFREAELRVHPGSAGASAFRQTFTRPLWIVLGVAGIPLIACANVASLLLARSTARSAEMPMRVSLGAGRSRLVPTIADREPIALRNGRRAWLGIGALGCASAGRHAFKRHRSRALRPGHGYARTAVLCRYLDTRGGIFRFTPRLASLWRAADVGTARNACASEQVPHGPALRRQSKWPLRSAL
jgi:hypothetical protein